MEISFSSICVSLHRAPQIWNAEKQCVQLLQDPGFTLRCLQRRGCRLLQWEPPKGASHCAEPWADHVALKDSTLGSGFLQATRRLISQLAGTFILQ